MGKVDYLRTPLQIQPNKPTIPVVRVTSIEQLLLEKLYLVWAYSMSENSGYDSFNRSLVSSRIVMYLIISEKEPNVVMKYTT